MGQQDLAKLIVFHVHPSSEAVSQEEGVEIIEDAMWRATAARPAPLSILAGLCGRSVPLRSHTHKAAEENGKGGNKIPSSKQYKYQPNGTKCVPFGGLFPQTA